MTILTLLVKYLVIFHADPCNKSYIYMYVGLSMANPYKKYERGGGGGGAAASSVGGSTGRQCLKISLVILRGGETDTSGGGGGQIPATLNTSL